MRILAAPVVVVLLLAALPARATIIASSVDDICAPADDPCVISERVVFDSFSPTLDFGARDVVVSKTGSLDIGDAQVEILCGNFTVSPGGRSIKLKRKLEDFVETGWLVVHARRRCLENPAAPCEASRDCPSGVCASGGGLVRIERRISGSGLFGGHVEIVADGDVHLAKAIRLAATDDEGGDMWAESLRGSVFVSGNISVRGRQFAEGGFITLLAEEDVKIDAKLQLAADIAGFLEVYAGRDISISGRINGNGTRAFGAGGGLELEAERDILVLGRSTKITTDARKMEGEAGEQDYKAGGDIVLSEGTLVAARAGTVDGSNGFIGLETLGGEVRIDGEVNMRAGRTGETGDFWVTSRGDLTLGSTGVIEVGGGFARGDILLESEDGDIDLLGKIDAIVGCCRGPVFIDVIALRGAVSVNATINLAAVGDSPFRASSNLLVEACDVEMGSSAMIRNSGDALGTQLVASRMMTLRRGAMILGAPASVNEITAPDCIPPATLDATIVPEPVLIPAACDLTCD